MDHLVEHRDELIDIIKRLDGSHADSSGGTFGMTPDNETEFHDLADWLRRLGPLTGWPSVTMVTCSQSPYPGRRSQQTCGRCLRKEAHMDKRIERGIVLAYHPWGYEVQLDGSGAVGLVGLGSASDVMMYRNQEYWPDLGQSILVKRLPSWSQGKLSFAALERNIPEALSGRDSHPQGLSAPEWGRVVDHRDTGIQVSLEESGDTGTVRSDLVNNDPELCTTDHWPQPGERVRVACLGVWPDGELRMTMRKLFIDMLSKPHFRHLAPHAPHPPSSNTIGGQSR